LDEDEDEEDETNNQANEIYKVMTSIDNPQNYFK
jgi:hypothetical protein